MICFVLHRHLKILLLNAFQELLDQVLNFQSEAKEALEAETPDSTKLEQLIEFGVTLDVDLSEIPKLKQVSMELLRFFVKVKT